LQQIIFEGSLARGQSEEVAAEEDAERIKIE
jgi:hypothetical protein